MGEEHLSARHAEHRVHESDREVHPRSYTRLQPRGLRSYTRLQPRGLRVRKDRNGAGNAVRIDSLAERAGFELPVPREISRVEFSLTLARYSTGTKGLVLERICSPDVRP
jgi:hypothetical protein